MASPPLRAQRILVALTLLATVALTGCFGSDSSDSGLDPGNAEQAPDYTAMVEKAPGPLADLYAEGGTLLDGGLDAYEQKIAALGGYPVVVNKWASWCGPCRIEFPAFQQQAAARGDEVAFLGVDVQDDAAAADTFLKGHPLPYPSFADPDPDISAAVGADFGTPATIFYDASGKIVHVKTGQYTDESELAADIDRYAVAGS
jgi:cytochrome c biogenesis protein CcmG/thiol:disulfide interchange protein DsbE